MMKLSTYYTLILCAFTLTSCYKPGKIQIQSNISEVKITDIYWGNIYVGSELLPGQSSAKIKVEKQDVTLPTKFKVSFTMTANNKAVYLQTGNEYWLDQDGDLLIVLSDDTYVNSTNN